MGISKEMKIEDNWTQKQTRTRTRETQERKATKSAKDGWGRKDREHIGVQKST